MKIYLRKFEKELRNKLENNFVVGTYFNNKIKGEKDFFIRPDNVEEILSKISSLIDLNNKKKIQGKDLISKISNIPIVIDYTKAKGFRFKRKYKDDIKVKDVLDIIDYIDVKVEKPKVSSKKIGENIDAKRTEKLVKHSPSKQKDTSVNTTKNTRSSSVIKSDNILQANNKKYNTHSDEIDFSSRPNLVGYEKATTKKVELVKTKEKTVFECTDNQWNIVIVYDKSTVREITGTAYIKNDSPITVSYNKNCKNAKQVQLPSSYTKNKVVSKIKNACIELGIVQSKLKIVSLDK